MFFIVGGGQNQKLLDFNQMIICPSCGQYGHIQVVMVYNYISLFFIPLIKWKKRYFVQMSCCKNTCELPQEVGRQIENMDITEIDEQLLKFEKVGKQCLYCGYTTMDDFQYCPKCGSKFI